MKTTQQLEYELMKLWKLVKELKEDNKVLIKRVETLENENTKIND